MEAQLAQMRVDYRREELDVGDLAGTWHEQLARWLDDAAAGGVVEPNAMVLATTSDDCTPSSRTVLCKGVDDRGVVFYTNYTSAKAHELRSMLGELRLRRQWTRRSARGRSGRPSTTAAIRALVMKIEGQPATEMGRIRRRQRLGGLLNYYARAV